MKKLNVESTLTIVERLGSTAPSQLPCHHHTTHSVLAAANTSTTMMKTFLLALLLASASAFAPAILSQQQSSRCVLSFWLIRSTTGLERFQRDAW